MNLTKKVVLILVSLFTISSFVFAGTGAESLSSYDRIENNLIVGLKSENRGLQLSAAYFLGEIKSEKAVIPLLAMLHNGGTESERIMAALSLYKINSERSIYAVKEAAKYDDSERVRKMCKTFYNDYLIGKLNTENVINVALTSTYGSYKLQDFEG